MIKGGKDGILGASNLFFGKNNICIYIININAEANAYIPLW
jgi:hypothetical protein